MNLCCSLHVYSVLNFTFFTLWKILVLIVNSRSCEGTLCFLVFAIMVCFCVSDTLINVFYVIRDICMNLWYSRCCACLLSYAAWHCTCWWFRLIIKFHDNPTLTTVIIGIVIKPYILEWQVGHLTYKYFSHLSHITQKRWKKNWRGLGDPGLPGKWPWKREVMMVRWLWWLSYLHVCNAFYVMFYGQLSVSTSLISR